MNKEILNLEWHKSGIPDVDRQILVKTRIVYVGEIPLKGTYQVMIIHNDNRCYYGEINGHSSYNIGGFKEAVERWAYLE